MKIVSTVLSLFIITVSTAQNAEWNHVLKGNNPYNPSMGQSRVATSDGGYWVAHLAQHRMTYGQDFMGDTRLVRFQNTGTLTDSFFITGKSHMKMLKYVSDKLYMWVGFFDSMKVGALSYYAPNNYRTWFGYRDAQGIHELGVMDDTVSALTVLPGGHVALATMYPHVLHEFTPLGGFHETYSIPGTGFIQSIEPGPQGGLLITGSCMSSIVKFDSIDIQNPHSYTNYILYLDQQRKGRWLRYIEDITCTPSAAVANGDAVYWSGSTYIDPAFDSLPYAGGPGLSSEDFFLTRLDNDRFDWVREIPGDSVFAGLGTGAENTLGADPEGNIYLLGTFRGNSVDWGSGISSGKLSNSYNVLLISWTPDGDVRWVKDMGGISLELAHEMVVTGVDDLVFTAALTDTFDFEGETIYADYGDVWLVKIGGNPAGTDGKAQKQHSLKLYPNPAQDLIFHNLQTKTAYQMLTPAGSIVKSGYLIPGEALDMSEMTAGIYFLKCNSGNQRILKF